MGDTVTIQKTSKGLKLQLILCWLAAIVAAFWLVCEHGNADVQMREADYFKPMCLLGAAAFWYVVTRFRIWWNHG